LASSAPATPFETASRCSPCDVTPEPKPGRRSPGVRVPFRAELRLGCPRSEIVATACAASPSCRARESPLSGFLFPRARLRRVPLCRSHRGVARSRGPHVRSRRVKVARPSPEPSSGFLPLSTVLAALAARTRPLRIPPFAVVPRRFAALFHAARAHWIRPSELSLPEEPYPLSRALSPLWVRAGPPNGAARSEVFAAPFADRADLPPRLARRLAGLKKPGRRFPGVARAPHVSRCRGRLRRLVSDRAGLAGLGCPTRPLRSVALLESPFADFDRHPGQGTIDRSVLSWASFPSRACSSSPWARCSRGRTKVGTDPAPCVLETRVPGHALSPGLASGRGV